MAVKFDKARSYNNNKETYKKDSVETNLSRLYTDLLIYSVPANKEIAFKSKLTNFEDQYSQNWDNETVYGRMDDIQSFSNTTREISVSWMVTAFSAIEAYDNLKNVSLLVNMQYPGYENHFHDNNWGFANANVISTPPLFRVKFGNLITSPNAGPVGSAKSSGLLCKMDGISYNPDLKEGVITSERGVILPKYFELNMKLVVLHTHELGWGEDYKKRRKNNSESASGKNFPYLITNEGGGPGSKADLETPEGQMFSDGLTPDSEQGIPETTNESPAADCSVQSSYECAEEERNDVSDFVQKGYKIIREGLIFGGK